MERDPVGENPKGGTSPNVAGRCWAEQGLESVRNAGKATEPKGGSFRVRWLPNIGKTPKGSKPQERKLPSV